MDTFEFNPLELGTVGLALLCVLVMLLIAWRTLPALLDLGRGLNETLKGTQRAMENVNASIMGINASIETARQVDKQQTDAITNLRVAITNQVDAISSLDQHTDSSIKEATAKIDAVAEAITSESEKTRQELGGQLHDIADSLKRFDATLSKDIQAIAAKLEAMAVQIKPAAHVLIEAKPDDKPEEPAA